VSKTYQLVMAGLVPAISIRRAPSASKRDRRDKLGDNDSMSHGFGETRPLTLALPIRTQLAA
jgi:hypothetical protein